MIGEIQLRSLVSEVFLADPDLRAVVTDRAKLAAVHNAFIAVAKEFGLIYDWEQMFEDALKDLRTRALDTNPPTTP